MYNQLVPGWPQLSKRPCSEAGRPPVRPLDEPMGHPSCRILWSLGSEELPQALVTSFREYPLRCMTQTPDDSVRKGRENSGFVLLIVDSLGHPLCFSI